MADSGRTGGVSGRRVSLDSLRSERTPKVKAERQEQEPKARADRDVREAVKTTEEAKAAVQNLHPDAVRRQVAAENRAAADSKPKDVEKLAKAIAKDLPDKSGEAVAAHKLDGERVTRLTTK